MRVSMYVEALGRRADLAGVEVGRPRAPARRDLDVDLAGHVGTDDERVLAAELEVDPLGAAQRDPPPGRDRPGERDAVDALVADDRLADVSRSRKQRDHARREWLEALSASISVEIGVTSDGLQTTTLPAARAGASFQASSSSG